jgi:hypothetical protein
MATLAKSRPLGQLMNTILPPPGQAALLRRVRRDRGGGLAHGALRLPGRAGGRASYDMEQTVLCRVGRVYDFMVTCNLPAPCHNPLPRCLVAQGISSAVVQPATGAFTAQVTPPDKRGQAEGIRRQARPGASRSFRPPEQLMAARLLCRSLSSTANDTYDSA